MVRLELPAPLAVRPPACSARHIGAEQRSLRESGPAAGRQAARAAGGIGAPREVPAGAAAEVPFA